MSATTSPSASAERDGAPQIGREMYALVSELYPICRSITGDGVRETLRIIGDRLRGRVGLAVQEVPSGTEVFDWTVPREWNIRDAWVRNSRGEKVIDFKRNNLHVLNYSVPVHKKLGLAELNEHLFSMPDRPEWVPYRTSYYREAWGFCLSHNQRQRLAEDEYEVFIDSTLEAGHLTYGECFIPGETEDEILISCHVCHPSLCNDNLSGISVATFLARELSNTKRRCGYRFLFIPGTIGSITWLSRNEDRAARVKHGVVLTCVGDRGGFTYKKSRRGGAEIDRAFANALARSGEPWKAIDFYPYGYDERQYCSPGFNLPVGCLMRTQHGTFPQYHTSADDLNFVTPESLAGTYRLCLDVFEVLENNRTYINQNPKCEPQLGKRGLYGTVGGTTPDLEMAYLWVLNFSDGDHSLLDIAERSGMAFPRVAEAARRLREAGLLLER
jgi:aminopeptidase-like protein